MAGEEISFYREKMEQLLKSLPKHGASDLHLQVQSPPRIRLAGKLRELKASPLNRDTLENYVRSILTDKQAAQLEENGSVDLAYGIRDEGRFRVNVFRQRGTLALAARRVNTAIPTFEDLHLPPILTDIASLEHGLVIVSGTTGSGKSTTLAAMVEHINLNRRCHVLTIEDPIEYLYTNKKAYINQREVGVDVSSFHDAIRYAVRQDPDVILVGEMRDAETLSFGLTAAETGHLVLSTLHSSTAPQTIGRILDLFPASQHQQVRHALQFHLKAVICQKLLPCMREDCARVPAVEVMLVNPPVRKAIGDGREVELTEYIKAGRTEGMLDFNTSLFELVQKQHVDRHIALEVSPNPDALEMRFRGILFETEKGGKIGSASLG